MARLLKTCQDCGAAKPRSEFAPRSSGYLERFCRPCAENEIASIQTEAPEFRRKRLNRERQRVWQERHQRTAVHDYGEFSF